MWFKSILVLVYIISLFFGATYIILPLPKPSPTTLVRPPHVAEAKPSLPLETIANSVEPSLPSTAPNLPSSDMSTKHFGAWLTLLDVDINPQALDIMESILNYADAKQIEHNHILTLIDYSLPANQKRLWVFDLDAHQLLFHTYVSHGIKSGSLETRFFSNRFDSKASSIGVYRTNKTYYGRHGLSLKLDGLDTGFNDNAEARAIVIHGGWYVEENFIKKYGRAGRSWGCPAVPKQFTDHIINTIKDKSLFVVYYPSTEWLVKSRFLKLEPNEILIKSDPPVSNTQVVQPETREDVLLAQIRKKHKYQETEAIVAMPADHYVEIFQSTVPLERMLRRQVDGQEYIALSKTEFDRMLSIYPQNSSTFQDVYFIMPEIKMSHGYYATEMHKMDFGAITSIQPSNTLIPTSSLSYTVQFANHTSIPLKTTHRFIRWLGL